MSSSVLDRVRRDDPSLTELSFSDIPLCDVDEVFTAFAGNTSITSIHVKSRRYSSFPIPKLVRLLTTIGTAGILPNLTELSLGQSLVRECPLPVRSLTRALRKIRSLKTLTLNWNDYDGDLLLALATALRRHPSIEFFELRMPSIRDAPILSSFFRSLASIPNLKRTRFLGTMTGRDNPWRGEGSNHLLRSSSVGLCYLHLVRFTLPWLKLFTEAVATNDHLSSLMIRGCRLTDEGCVEVAEAMKVNQSILFLDLSTNRIGNAGLRGLADALRANRTLKSLRLTNQTTHDNRQLVRAFSSFGVDHLIEALTVNETLIELNFGSPVISSEGVMSEEEIAIERQQERAIEFYTTLNKAGRRHPNASRALWGRILSQISDNPDCFFHYLSQNPVIYQRHDDETDLEPVAKRARIE